jgi:hypothetical protein
MRNRPVEARSIGVWLRAGGFMVLLLLSVAPAAAEENLVTTVSARTGNGYKRSRLKDGSFRAESYVLSEGGRIAGTMSDFTVDRVKYHDVAELAIKLLGRQNYQYDVRNTGNAKLLLVLFWGCTIAEHGTRREQSQSSLALGREALKRLNQGKDLEGTAPPPTTSRTSYAAPEEAAAFDSEVKRLLQNPRTRDQLNEHNARVLGFWDDLNKASGVQRWAGGGNRYDDLLAQLNESRYYVVILAYDFAEFKKGRKKLQWTTRVSVSSAGNRFDESVVAMLRSAVNYSGQDSGGLMRGEQPKAVVELRDLRFLGETQGTPATKSEGQK